MNSRTALAFCLGVALHPIAATAGVVTIPLPDSPNAIVAFPANGKVYVTTGTSTTQLLEIDPAKNMATTPGLTVGASPTGLAIDPLYGTVFEASGAAPNPGKFFALGVTVMYVTSPMITWVIPLENGVAPTAIAYNSATQHLFVASASDQSLHILDASQSGNQAPQWLDKISLGHVPTDIAVDEVGNFVYISTADGLVIPYQGFDNNIVAPVPVGSTAAHVVVSRLSHHDDLKLGENVFVTTDSGVAVIPFGRMAPIQIALPGQTPGALALNDATGNLFVTDSAHNAVTVIDAHANTARATQIPVGNKPTAITVLVSNGSLIAGDNAVYVANSADNTVSVFMDPALGADLITLGVRWCAVEGSPAADSVTVPPNAVSAGGTSKTDAALLEVLRQATSQVWLNQAHIAFRAAIPSASVNAAFPSHFPIVADPDPSHHPDPPQPLPSTQHLGDISLDNKDFQAVSKECELAWAQFPQQGGGSIIAVNVRQFLGGGETSMTAGVTPQPENLVYGESDSQRLCTSPRFLNTSDVTGLDVAVIDQENYGPKDLNGHALFTTGSGALSLAHELGHALLLGHGDGVDNDQNGTLPPSPGLRRYDGYCDKTYNSFGTDTPYRGSDNQCLTTDPTMGGDFLMPIEDNLKCLANFVSPTSCGSIMQPAAFCPVLTPLQIETARDAARVTPGFEMKGAMDPYGVLMTTSDCRKPGCTAPADLVTTKVEIGKAPGSGAGEISLSVDGNPASKERGRYVVLVDTDDNAGTGCEDNPWAKPLLRGAELAITVDTVGRRDRVLASASVWQCRAGVFKEWDHPRPQVLSQRIARGVGRPWTRITIPLPLEASRSIQKQVRIAATALRLNQNGRTTTGGLQLGPGVINLVPPVLPTCTVNPTLAKVGQDVLLHADYLTPNKSLRVFFADEEIASGQTNAGGSFDQTVKVPAGQAKLVQISIVEDDSAFSAECVVSINNDRAGRLPPQLIATLAPRVRYPRQPVKVGALISYELAMGPVTGSEIPSSTIDLEFDARVLRVKNVPDKRATPSRGRVRWALDAVRLEHLAELRHPPGVVADFEVISCPRGGKTYILAGVQEARGSRIEGEYLPARSALPIAIPCGKSLQSAR